MKTNVERQQEYRLRLKEKGLVSVRYWLAPDVVEAVNKRAARDGVTRSQVVEKLIRAATRKR